jgi:long-chain fatty acid transport protein
MEDVTLFRSFTITIIKHSIGYRIGMAQVGSGFRKLVSDKEDKLIHPKRLMPALLFLTLILPGTALGGTPVDGSKAAGMGTAFVAVADDPSAIAYNPAGLTQLNGTNIYGGGTIVIPSTTYESPSGQSENTESQVFFPPHFYACSNLGTTDFQFGIGLFSPFGIGGRKWSEDGLTRYVSLENNVLTLSANPTVAYRISPRLSVALGVNYTISRIEAERKIDQSAVGGSDGESVLKEDGGGWSYNFGVLFKPDERWSLGLAYRSKIEIDYSGHLEIKNIAPALQPLFGGSYFETGVHTSSDFPQVVSLGAAFRPSKKWTISLDAEWFGWSSFKESTLRVEHKVPEAGITDNTAPLNWKDVWTIKLGAEYKITEKFSLRGGYAYIQSPVPDLTLDPSNPDSTQHYFSIGLGYKTGKYILDFFYMAGFLEDREVQNPILTGKYENFVHQLGFSLGRSF